MATNLEELEKRLVAVEHEVKQLRQMLKGPPVEETPVERARRRLEEMKADQAALTAAWDKAFKEMGITGEPIGAEKVQEMIAACGIDPKGNEFSRGIIAMREE